MTSYTLKGRITEDHRLEVDLPADAPVGDAEVTVVIGPAHVRRGNAAAFLETLDQINCMHPDRPRRTKEEIDAELNAMRDEWDSD